MGIYDVNLLSRRAAREPDLRARLAADPEAVLAEADLTEAERRALLAGDVTELYNMGVNAYLLLVYAKHGLLGLDFPTFSERLRRATPRVPA